MSRHIEYSDPSEPTRTDAFAGSGLPLVAGCEYDPTDAPPMTQEMLQSALHFIKQNHEKWDRKWQYGIDCENELAACGQLPLCYRRTV